MRRQGGPRSPPCGIRQGNSRFNVVLPWVRRQGGRGPLPCLSQQGNTGEGPSTRGPRAAALPVPARAQSGGRARGCRGQQLEPGPPPILPMKCRPPVRAELPLGPTSTDLDPPRPWGPKGPKRWENESESGRPQAVNSAAQWGGDTRHTRHADNYANGVPLTVRRGVAVKAAKPQVARPRRIPRRLRSLMTSRRPRPPAAGSTSCTWCRRPACWPPWW
jgi:hypothetical protein